MNKKNIGSQKLKKRIKQGFFKILVPPKNSYSQAGEDRIIKFLFQDKKIYHIQYLDIGINDPEFDNNTMIFYLEGSTGVLVEANTAKIPHIKKIRPNDTVLNIGVAVSDQREADFFIFDTPGINTFDKEEAERRQAHGTWKIVAVVKMPLININDLIKQYFDPHPDLLSLDIEGLDLEVLRTLEYPIPVICVETCTYSENHLRPKVKGFNELMESKGYMVYADTYINTIYVNKEWFCRK